MVDVRRERLDTLTFDGAYGDAETVKEGFPPGHPYNWPSEFVKFFCASHRGCTPETIVTRIEFEYVN